MTIDDQDAYIRRDLVAASFLVIAVHWLDLPIGRLLSLKALGNAFRLAR